MFPIGNQSVGIVTKVPVLDIHGDPVVSEFMEPDTDESVVWVEGCLFESQFRKVVEQQADAVTTSEPAWAIMPVTDVTSAITSSQVLRHDGRDYVMRGDAVTERNIHGWPVYVFCDCERQTG